MSASKMANNQFQVKTRPVIKSDEGLKVAKGVINALLISSVMWGLFFLWIFDATK